MELKPETEENIEAIQDDTMLLEGADTAKSGFHSEEQVQEDDDSKYWIKDKRLRGLAFLVAIVLWGWFMTDSVQSLRQEYEPLYPAMMSSPLNDENGTYLLISHANW